jgi:hypothetical protein
MPTLNGSNQTVKFLRIACVFSIVMLTLLLGCGKKNGTEPEAVKYKWTILGYFDGNNSEDQTPDGHSYVIQDLQELEQIDSTQDVQVVVMLSSFKTDGDARYYHVERHLNEPPDVISSEILSLPGKKDMSHPSTLRDFIAYGTENFPAQHYMLIINDHGGGWRGLCSDTVNGTGDWMTLTEFSSAISGFNFDIIWFYTPSMSTAEVAYQIKDRTQYMIASQLKWYPKNIMGSTEWLPILTDNPDVNLRVFAVAVTEAIFNAANGVPSKGVQSVLIHLPKIAQLASDVSILGTALKEGTGPHWPEVWSAWETAYYYNSSHSESSLVDLREFAGQIQDQPNLSAAAKAAASAVEASVNAAVIADFVYPEVLGDFGGISIHLPWNHENFDSVSYVQLDFDQTGWPGFVSAFLQTFSTDYAGALNISSVPPGARVFLNSVDTGQETNVLIGDLFPGFYDIKLVKSGYQDWNLLQLEVLPGQTTPLHVILFPAP